MVSTQRKNLKNYNEINEKYDFLHKNIMEVINKALMREQTKKGNENEKDTPWITTGILKSVKTKNILPKQCFRNKGLYTYHTRHTGTKQIILLEKIEETIIINTLQTLQTT